MRPEIDDKLGDVLKIVRAALSPGDQQAYLPTLFVFSGDNVSIHTLFRGLPAGGTLSAVERFAFRAGSRDRAPEFVFFAAQSVSEGGGDELMISGCSDVDAVVAYLTLSRAANGCLCVGEISQSGSPDKIDRLPAWRAMKGLRKKLKAPWWRVW